MLRVSLTCHIIDTQQQLTPVVVPDDLTTANNEISWYYPYVWKSYPYELPRVTFEEIELARGLYYTSGIESFISTMETSALMGMNVAQLIVDDYFDVLEKPATEGQQVMRGSNNEEL